jgi:hypothetical protein
MANLIPRQNAGEHEEVRHGMRNSHWTELSAAPAVLLLWRPRGSASDLAVAAAAPTACRLTDDAAEISLPASPLLRSSLEFPEGGTIWLRALTGSVAGPMTLLRSGSAGGVVLEWLSAAFSRIAASVVNLAVTSSLGRCVSGAMSIRWHHGAGRPGADSLNMVECVSRMERMRLKPRKWA